MHKRIHFNDEVVESLGTQGKTYPTPFIFTDLEVIKANCREFRQIFPNIKLFYAMKALSDLPVIKAVDKLVDGYDVASINEIKKLLFLGVAPHRIAFSNPVKPEAAIRDAYAAGIRMYAAQSTAELIKIARSAPSAQVYIRIKTEDSHSQVPLSTKFGCSFEQAGELLELAHKLHITPAGVTFHVGSQTDSPESWRAAIHGAQHLLNSLKQEGIDATLINIGGGFPAQLFDDDLPLSDFAALNDMIRNNPDYTYVAEPGRRIVANSSVLVASVIGIEERDGKHWAFLDVGKFQVFLGALNYEHFPYVPKIYGRQLPLHHKRTKSYVLTGPSCDSQDVIAEDIHLPSDLAVGDKLIFPNFGAYTTEYGTNFNGFMVPTRIYSREQLTAAEPSAIKEKVA